MMLKEERAHGKGASTAEVPVYRTEANRAGLSLSSPCQRGPQGSPTPHHRTFVIAWEPSRADRDLNARVALGIPGRVSWTWDRAVPCHQRPGPGPWSLPGRLAAAEAGRHQVIRSANGKGGRS